MRFLLPCVSYKPCFSAIYIKQLIWRGPSIRQTLLTCRVWAHSIRTASSSRFCLYDYNTFCMLLRPRRRRLTRSSRLRYKPRIEDARDRIKPDGEPDFPRALQARSARHSSIRCCRTEFTVSSKLPVIRSYHLEDIPTCSAKPVSLSHVDRELNTLSG
jgi:hypothetical protein